MISRYRHGATNLDLGCAFAFGAVFGDEFPIELAATGFEQSLEGGTDGAFVLDAELVELGKGVVIVLDDFVGGLELQRHRRERLKENG